MMRRSVSSLVQNSGRGQILPLSLPGQATFRETGMPKLVLMFMILHPAAVSTFWAGRLRARRLRPISVLYLSTATSTKEGRL